MCAKVETRSYARGLEWGADLGALCECAARERCGRRLKLIFAGLAGKSAGNVLNMAHTLLLWRCAPGLGARVELVRHMNGGAVEATMLGGKALTASLVRRKNDGDAVEAAFRWLGWENGGRCAGKGRDVRLIGRKALRRSG